MNTPKDQFTRNADDVKSALILLKGDTFQKLLIFARAEFSCKNPTAEQGRGAQMFENILMNLPEDEKSDIPRWDEIASGAHLDHQLEVPINYLHKEKTETKPA